MKRGVAVMLMGANRVRNARLVAVLVTALAAILAASVLALVAARTAEAAYPGGNGEIVFFSGRSGSPGLYKITVGGTATKIPGTSNGDNHPAWSPDGSRIAFTSASRTNYELTVMNANGSGRRQLTSTSVAEEEPTWSPDGTRIAFVRGGEIYAINADGSGETNLTNNPADDSEPAWSPDGTRIAFVSSRAGVANRNIYVMNSDGSGTAVDLTQNSTTPLYQGHDDHPSWSPNGAQIAYSNNGDNDGSEGGDADIYKMDANPATTDWTNLTDANSGLDVEPAWSPNGSNIAYVATTTTTDRNIFVMDANVAGSGAAIDTNAAHDIRPDWQPDHPACDISDTTGANVLNGTAADETICGLGGNDLINGGGGNDILMGGDGNDTLIAPSGRATLNGGAGADTASFAGSATPIEASLVTGFAQRVGTAPLEGAALVAIESLTGSDLDDTLRGAGTANRLIGGAGADTLLGAGGNDRLDSKDNVNGNDTVNGSAGTDRCTTDRREASIRSC